MNEEHRNNLKLFLKQILAIMLIISSVVVVMFFLSTQSLNIVPSHSGVLIDFRTYGFYSPCIRKITLIDVGSNKTIWDVHAKSDCVELDTLSLVKGENPVNPGLSAYAKVVQPESGNTFPLESMKRYKILVVSKTGPSSSGSGSQTSKDFIIPQ